MFLVALPNMYTFESRNLGENRVHFSFFFFPLAEVFLFVYSVDILAG